MWTSFIGFMASGKTTVARELHRGTLQPLVDLDDEVARRADLTLPEIFGGEGVSGFRRRESEVVASLPARRTLLVATGAGLVETPSAVEVLRRRGIVFWLDAPWEVLRDRLERDAAGRQAMLEHLGWDGLQRLYLRRRRLYAAAADFRLWTDRDDVERVARSVLLRSLVWRRRGREQEGGAAEGPAVAGPAAEGPVAEGPTVAGPAAEGPLAGSSGGSPIEGASAEGPDPGHPDGSAAERSGEGERT